MTNRYHVNRRRFLQGLSATGAAFGFSNLFGRWDAAAQSNDGLRLLVIRRPNGTVRGDWLASNNTFGPILQPFNSLKSKMLVFKNLDMKTGNGGDASHEGGAVTLMTGTNIGSARPPSNDDWRNTTASLDQLIFRQAPGMTDTRALVLASHNRQDGAPEVANLHLSYSGGDQPIAPDIDAGLASTRIFGNVMPTDQAAVRRARNRKAVIDYAQKDLAKLQTLAPASEKPALDAHAASLEALERQLTQPPMMGCTVPNVTGGLPGDTHDAVLTNARKHFALIKAAFTCNLSRVVTFSWSAGASAVQFSNLYSGMSPRQHHGRSHDSYGDANVRRDIGAIDTWYSQQTAAFVNELATTPDAGGGMLLDKTLVLYVSEVGSGDHTFNDMPIVLFGGSATKLLSDKVMDVGGRTTNDLWLAIARRFGAPINSLGNSNQSQGALSGVFS